jgi:uncharacterized protein Yka (UPF0111/DUF47 family)
MDNFFFGPVTLVLRGDHLNLVEKLESIMNTQEQLAMQLNALTGTVAKIQGETQTLLTLVASLEAAVIAAGSVKPEVQAAMDALTAQIAVVDALVPDAPPVDPAPVDPAPVDPPVDPTPTP